MNTKRFFVITTYFPEPIPVDADKFEILQDRLVLTKNGETVAIFDKGMWCGFTHEEMIQPDILDDDMDGLPSINPDCPVHGH